MTRYFARAKARLHTTPGYYAMIATMPAVEWDFSEAINEIQHSAESALTVDEEAA